MHVKLESIALEKVTFPASIINRIMQRVSFSSLPNKL